MIETRIINFFLILNSIFICYKIKLLKIIKDNKSYDISYIFSFFIIFYNFFNHLNLYIKFIYLNIYLYIKSIYKIKNVYDFTKEIKINENQ